MSELLGGGSADEDPIPHEDVDLHPLPKNAAVAPGFHQDALNNVVDGQDEQMWEHDENWVQQQPLQHNEALHNLLDAVQQEELDWADGGELLPENSGNSSLTSDMSFSKGDNANNLNVLAPFPGVDHQQMLVVPMVAPLVDGDLGISMQFITQAYP